MFRLLSIILFVSRWKTSIGKMKSYTKLPRIYYPNKVILGNTLQLETHIGHYLKNVLRLKNNDQFRCFNENDGEYICEYISSTSSKKNQIAKAIALIRPSEPRHQLNFPLYFVPIKNSKMKSFLESCTELGIQHYIPVISQNMNCNYDDFDAFTSRLIESAEQSEQMYIPSIQKQITLKQLLHTWSKLIDEIDKYNEYSKSTINDNRNNSNKDDDNSTSSTTTTTTITTTTTTTTTTSSLRLMKPILYVCRERIMNSTSFSTTIRTTLLSQLSTCTNYMNTQRSNHEDDNHNINSDKNIHDKYKLPGNPFYSQCGLLIGPEGGFTQEELQLMSTYSFIHFVSLGNSILRAETAAITAVSILKDQLQDYVTFPSNDNSVTESSSSHLSDISIDVVDIPTTISKANVLSSNGITHTTNTVEFPIHQESDKVKGKLKSSLLRRKKSVK